MTEHLDISADDLLDAIDVLSQHGDVYRRDNAPRWEGMSAAIFAVLEAGAVRQGIPADQARCLAAVQVLALAEYGGGQQLYLPKPDRLRSTVRDARLYADYQGGATMPALQARYRLSVAYIYEVIDRQKQIWRRRQPSLF